MRLGSGPLWDVSLPWSQQLQALVEVVVKEEVQGLHALVQALFEGHLRGAGAQIKLKINTVKKMVQVNSDVCSKGGGFTSLNMKLPIHETLVRLVQISLKDIHLTSLWLVLLHLKECKK